MIDFYYKIDIEDFTICSKYNLVLANWKSKRSSLKTYLRQFSNCSLARALNKEEIFSLALDALFIRSQTSSL